MSKLTRQDHEELAYAVDLLEHPSLAARLCDMAGAPIDDILARLPAPVRGIIQPVTRKALEAALSAAMSTMDRFGTPSQPRELLHKVCASAAGGIGGALGGAGLAVELPLTTTLMMRSIAAIARSEGEDLARVDARLACMEVFALGGDSHADDHSETGYLAVRAALAKGVGDAAEYLARVAVMDSSAPALVRFIGNIAARFGVVVSQKAAAQLVPVVGGIGGAIVNTIFMDHYQTMARGHFIVRRLERACGREPVRDEYQRLKAKGCQSP